MNREDELLAKLEEFYKSAQLHHSISFWVSLIVVGVGILVSSIATGLIVDSPQFNDEAVMLVVCGVLIQFVGAVFFYIYNKNIDNMNSSFSQFMAMQNIKYVIELVGKIDKKNKDHMYMNIINMLLLKNEGQAEFMAELIKELGEEPKL